MQECGNPNQKELYSYGQPKKRLKHWTFLPCMAMLVLLYSSTSLRSCTTVNIIPLKTNMQIQRRQVHCGLRVDHWAINLHLDSLLETNRGSKKCQWERQGVCREMGADTRLPWWN